MPNYASSKDAIEFPCRAAANHEKRCSISAAAGHGQNGLKTFITIRFPATARQFSRTKMRFSAVDSGIEQSSFSDIESASWPASHEGDCLAARDALASIAV